MHMQLIASLLVTDVTIKVYELEPACRYRVVYIDSDNAYLKVEEVDTLSQAMREVVLFSLVEFDLPDTDRFAQYDEEVLTA